MEHLEIELKLYISNLHALREQLLDLGAVCIDQRTFEYMDSMPFGSFLEIEGVAALCRGFQ